MKKIWLLVAVLPMLLIFPAASQTVTNAPKLSNVEFSYVDILSVRDNKISNNLIEKINPSVLSQDKERYITPFSEEAQRVLVDAFIRKERSRHYSLGVIVNVALSSREILGYSEVARLQSVLEIGIDPLDLNIENRAEDEPDAYINKWLDWRRAKLLSLMRKIAISYKANFKDRRIYICGNSNYYESLWFNDLRSGQDWKSWLKTGLFDGAVLRGNWDEHNGDSKAFRIARSELRHSKILLHEGHRTIPEIYPLLENSPKSHRYNTQCANILRYAPDLSSVFAHPNSSKNYKKFINFRNGLTLPKYRAIDVGELIDQWPLQNSDGLYIDWDAYTGKREIALLLCPGDIDGKVSQILSTITPKYKQVSLVTSKVPSKSKMSPEISKLVLIDKNKTLLNLYHGKTTLLLFDSAGFLRYINRTPSVSSISGTVTTNIQIPKHAPDFAVTDMNGKQRRLSLLGGKKNLLLTFFPKCFTGGCTNHLSSINQYLSDFYKKDTEVWAVSIDTGDIQRDFAAMWNLKIPIIPDTGRNLCLLYGAAKNTNQLADRMSVFIDKNGIVKWIDKDVHILTHGSDLLERMKS